MLRRSFFSRMGGAAAALGFVDQKAADAAPAAPAGSFEPARHDQDNWFDELPGSHRVLFDTWTAARFGEGLMFAGNIYRANRDGYGLTEKDLAVIICVRHNTAPFAFNDAMWAKYNKAFCKRMEWVEPKTNQPPTVNIYTRQLTNFVKQGLNLAVCNLTTRAYTQIIAQETQRSTDEVYKELTSNTVGNAHFVPAGVVAATRAQERGYSIVSIG
jgi:intracellular sulfur oxidation DsrE/DsrF family protein